MKWTAEQLADFLDKRAAELRAECKDNPFDYGRGNDRGLAQGFSLAASHIREHLT
jgi:hypothetical protein